MIEGSMYEPKNPFHKNLLIVPHAEVAAVGA